MVWRMTQLWHFLLYFPALTRKQTDELNKIIANPSVRDEDKKKVLGEENIVTFFRIFHHRL